MRKRIYIAPPEASLGSAAQRLRVRMEQAAVRDRDRQIADEWFAVDQQAWRQIDEAERRRDASIKRSR